METIIKTREQWLSELPYPYNEKALENLVKLISLGRRKPNLLLDSLANALDSAFTFMDSPEGSAYWYELLTCLRDEQYIHNNIQLELSIFRSWKP